MVTGITLSSAAAMLREHTQTLLLARVKEIRTQCGGFKKINTLFK